MAVSQWPSVRSWNYKERPPRAATADWRAVQKSQSRGFSCVSAIRRMIDTPPAPAYISKRANSMGATPFGEHLKREREMRGVSLEEISAATRIGTRFLEALENERWNELPGGIFNRGFIRAVAHFLGLDEESLIAEYALATNDQLEVAVLAKASAPRRGWIVAGAATAIAVLVLGGWLAYRQIATRMRASQNGGAQTAPAVPAGSPAGTSRAAANSPSGYATPTKDLLELKVDAGKPSQVKIMADGKTVFSGELSPGESQHFQARESFAVSSSDASALVLELNGQTQPPIGPPGQSGSVTLKRKDLKKQPGGRD